MTATGTPIRSPEESAASLALDAIWKQARAIVPVAEMNDRDALAAKCVEILEIVAEQLKTCGQPVCLLWIVFLLTGRHYWL